MSADEKQQTQSENKMSDEKQQTHLENKIKEMHSNIRHITQLAMNWFVFFVTINYATMGWLAAGTVNLNPFLMLPIAVVFIIQNWLGIVSLNVTECVITEMGNKVDRFEQSLIKEGQDLCIKCEAKSIPIELYANLKKSMLWVLRSLVCAWVFYVGIRLIYDLCPRIFNWCKSI
jgi:hypothetical protein